MQAPCRRTARAPAWRASAPRKDAVRRYGLRSRPEAVRAAPAALAAALREADAEPDAELRADALGQVLLLQREGLQLCYDSQLTLQQLEPAGAVCDGQAGRPLQHFPHSPIQGRAVRL